MSATDVPFLAPLSRDAMRSPSAAGPRTRWMVASYRRHRPDRPGGPATNDELISPLQSAWEAVRYIEVAGGCRPPVLRTVQSPWTMDRASAREPSMFQIGDVAQQVGL